MIKISKDEAKKLGLNKYFTGKPCKNGMISERRASTSNCLCDICQSIVRDKKRISYHKNKNNPKFKEKILNYTIMNKEKKREYDKKYYLSNKDRISKRVMDLVSDNRDRRRVVVKNYDSKRRSVKSNGMETSDLRLFIEDSDKVCFYCDKDCDKDFHVDHIIPLSKGGEHERYNLCISCPTCNLRKNSLDPEEFIDRVISGYYDLY